MDIELFDYSPIIERESIRGLEAPESPSTSV